MTEPRFWKVRLTTLDLPPCYVKASSRGKARYRATKAAREVGYRVHYDESRAVASDPPPEGHFFYTAHEEQK